MIEDISEEDLKRWQNATAEELINELKRINDNFEEHHAFGNVNIETRHQLREIFCRRFGESPKIRQQILRFLRILARDKNNLEELLSGILVQNVLSAGLLAEQSIELDWETLIQAEMCLINLLFNSNLARNEFTDVSSGMLLNRIRLLTDTENTSSKHSDVEEINVALENDAESEKPGISVPQTFPVECLDTEQIDLIAFYDLRIAFVASAHLKKLQLRWLRKGCEVFLKILACSLHFPEKLKQNTDYKSVIERTNWTLKTLFNIFCYSSQEDVMESTAEQCLSLCSEIVRLENVDPSLEQSAVDVISVVPLSLELLVPKLQFEQEKEVKETHDGRDMTFADAVLRALERRLETENGEDTELLGTFLTVLLHLCTQVKEARRYLRLRVIPPLHASDVERRPDEGAELRNRMIRLMMSVSNARDLASEVIFILCKKSVNRFVKYCGFGNAAGLLANRGILGALNAPRHPSDSEDSETEDYKAVEAQVNPVTGCIEPRREDPFAGMTEEQKEYEVHRLMNDISKLMNQGVIAPGRIGEDGQLRPVKHVLELVKDADVKPDKNDSDSDVD